MLLNIGDKIQQKILATSLRDISNDAYDKQDYIK